MACIYFLHLLYIAVSEVLWSHMMKLSYRQLSLLQTSFVHNPGIFCKNFESSQNWNASSFAIGFVEKKWHDNRISIQHSIQTSSTMQSLKCKSYNVNQNFGSPSRVNTCFLPACLPSCLPVLLLLFSSLPASFQYKYNTTIIQK